MGGVTSVPQQIEEIFPAPLNNQYPGYTITTESLMEALAILKESIFSVDYDEAADGEVLRNAGAIYTFALSYARNALENHFDWDVQPVEVEAALNLALWPPFIPSGLSEFRCWQWDDIEPGHRFQRIIDWLSTRPTSLTHHDSLTQDGRNELFHRFWEVGNCGSVQGRRDFAVENAERKKRRKISLPNPSLRTSARPLCLCGEKISLS